MESSWKAATANNGHDSKSGISRINRFPGSFAIDLRGSAARSIIEPLAAFLATGVTPVDAVRYNCHAERPEVLYYATATAAALSQTSRLGMGDYSGLAERLYDRVRGQQNADGGVKFFSRRNYGVLRDCRS